MSRTKLKALLIPSNLTLYFLSQWTCGQFISSMFLHVAWWNSLGTPGLKLQYSLLFYCCWGLIHVMTFVSLALPLASHNKHVECVNLVARGAQQFSCGTRAGAADAQDQWVKSAQRAAAERSVASWKTAIHLPPQHHMSSASHSVQQY